MSIDKKSELVDNIVDTRNKASNTKLRGAAAGLGFGIGTMGLNSAANHGHIQNAIGDTFREHPFASLMVPGVMGVIGINHHYTKKAQKLESDANSKERQLQRLNIESKIYTLLDSTMANEFEYQPGYANLSKSQKKNILNDEDTHRKIENIDQRDELRGHALTVGGGGMALTGLINRNPYLLAGGLAAIGTNMGMGIHSALKKNQIINNKLSEVSKTKSGITESSETIEKKYMMMNQKERDELHQKMSEDPDMPGRVVKSALYGVGTAGSITAGLATAIHRPDNPYSYIPFGLAALGGGLLHHTNKQSVKAMNDKIDNIIDKRKDK